MVLNVSILELIIEHDAQRPVYKKWPDKEGLVNEERMPSPTCASLSADAEGNLVNCLKLFTPPQKSPFGDSEGE